MFEIIKTDLTLNEMLLVRDFPHEFVSVQREREGPKIESKSQFHLSLVGNSPKTFSWK